MRSGCGFGSLTAAVNAAYTTSNVGVFARSLSSSGGTVVVDLSSRWARLACGRTSSLARSFRPPLPWAVAPSPAVPATAASPAMARSPSLTSAPGGRDGLSAFPEPSPRRHLAASRAFRFASSVVSSCWWNNRGDRRSLSSFFQPLPHLPRFLQPVRGYLSASGIGSGGFTLLMIQPGEQRKIAGVSDKQRRLMHALIAPRPAARRRSHELRQFLQGCSPAPAGLRARGLKPAAFRVSLPRRNS